jgi:hypothetical protein
MAVIYNSFWSVEGAKRAAFIFEKYKSYLSVANVMTHGNYRSMASLKCPTDKMVRDLLYMHQRILDGKSKINRLSNSVSVFEVDENGILIRHMVCKKCGINDRVKLSKSVKTGIRWSGHHCPWCTSEGKELMPSYKKVVITGKTLRLRGMESELVAIDFFKDNGFNVLKHAKARGPDLVIGNNKSWFTVEVKSIYPNNNQPRCYRISPVYKNRTCDDFVVGVKGGQVYLVEDMATYLSKTDNTGRRFLLVA